MTSSSLIELERTRDSNSSSLFFVASSLGEDEKSNGLGRGEEGDGAVYERSAEQ
jgi:hypothetical protein